MNNIAKFLLRKSENSRYAECKKEKIRKNDWVILEIDGVQEAAQFQKIINQKEIDSKFIRIANLKDLSTIESLEKEEKNYASFFKNKVKEYHLEMELADTALSFDTKRITFFYTAKGRVDFRDLLKDLIKSIRKLIRLQQIGMRDSTQMLKGCFGICGQELCCQRFLKNVGKINVKTAGFQNLDTVSTNKITGLCGKLMCCLSFEEETYKALLKKYPEVGKKVKTKKGIGVIENINPILGKVVVKLDNGDKIVVEKKYS